MGRVDTLVEPSLEEARLFVADCLARRQVLLLLAQCEVEYVGRGGSRLGDGERLIIAKQDGSLLVHRPIMPEAVNYQPSGSLLSVDVQGNRLILSAHRLKPRESLRVLCSHILCAASARLLDQAEFEKGPGEEDLYRAVCEYLAQEEPGLHLNPARLPTGPGFPDLVGWDGEGRYVVVEVKAKTADPVAVKQLYKYVSTFHERGASVRGILAAPRISRSAARLLSSLGLEFRRLEPRGLSRRAASKVRHELRLL